MKGYQNGDGFAWWHYADGGTERRHDPESEHGRGCSAEGHENGDGFSRGDFGWSSNGDGP